MATASSASNAPAPNARSRSFGLSRPIRLLNVEQDGTFSLSAEAGDLLPPKEVPVKVIAVAGLYRTGKSFLLNLLAEQHGADKQFRVGHTTNACTHGIHMWLACDDSICYILLDCEGSGSLEGDRTRDARLFALAVLFSSVFIFNSRGALEETSIQALSLVTNLAWEIQKKAGTELPPPTFLWVLRDTFLKLEDPAGNAITSDEYLSMCLEDETAKRSPRARSAREKLCQLFQDRHLHTLVQPTTEENDLQNLSSLSHERLRPDFLDQVQRLRKKAFAISPKKGLKGKPILPRQWWSFIEACVECMNSASCPVVVDMWTAMGHKECSRALIQGREEFDRILSTATKSATSTQQANLVKKAHTEAMAKFRSVAIGDSIKEYADELEEEIERKANALRNERELKDTNAAKETLARIWRRDVTEPIEVAQRMRTIFDLDAAVEKVREAFLLECKLPNALSIYEDYVSIKVEEADALCAIPPEEEVIDPVVEEQARKELWQLPKPKSLDLLEVKPIVNGHSNPGDSRRASLESAKDERIAELEAALAAKNKACCVIQ